ncbi:MAG: hypothetical protein V3V12_08315 [Gammaproteobacteria bacterium]
MKKTLIVLVASALTVSMFLAIQQGFNSWLKEETREEIMAQGSCDSPVMRGVKHTNEEICALELIKERCGELDQCFVDCYTSGEGVDIAGGCAHICNYGWRIDWQSPKGTKECYGEPGEKT